MSYQYDLADFKRFLHAKNPKYRVDGLIFWQNRIPLPIDLFNRIFDEADAIIVEYINQVTASALAFSCGEELLEKFGTQITSLPSSELEGQQYAVAEWSELKLQEMPHIRLLAFDIAEILGLEEFKLSSVSLAVSLSHQGKKYSRLFMPETIKECFNKRGGADEVGKDNTDMFGNIIADRYNIYRSGFSDALAIIFNALLEFRILCAGRGSNLKRLSLTVEKTEGIDIRLGKTADGSLWQPGYDDDHYVLLSTEHPLLRNRSEAETGFLAELLYYIAEFENNQFSDTQRKLLENMRQEVSRGLWIRHD
ncbi:MAG: hypothetical protein RBS14_01395 [Atribacterota bacterium]|jgi:hypothetical protein|nr:hypothetical protein [Atribacterota bacterium]